MYERVWLVHNNHVAIFCFMFCQVVSLIKMCDSFNKPYPHYVYTGPLRSRFKWSPLKTKCLFFLIFSLFSIYFLSLVRICFLFFCSFFSELVKNDIDLPLEMTQSLMLLHSYLLVKVTRQAYRFYT